MQERSSDNKLMYYHKVNGTLLNTYKSLTPALGLSGKSEFTGLYTSGERTYVLDKSITTYTAFADGNVRNMAVLTGAARRGIVWYGVGLSISTSGAVGLSLSIGKGWYELESYYKSYSY